LDVVGFSEHFSEVFFLFPFYSQLMVLMLNEFCKTFSVSFFEFRGKIVIVRYGEIFRGDKCHMAEQRGAVGCLIYSDPQDDGTSENDLCSMTKIDISYNFSRNC
jgi:hypothetical protein